MCVTVCPHAVFAIKQRKAQIIDRDACMECGACAKNCPSDAITVNAGVGCVAAIIKGALTGSEPDCGCGPESCCSAVSLTCNFRPKSAGLSCLIIACLAKYRTARASDSRRVAHMW